MITGVVNAAYQAVITLALQGPSGRTREIEAVVDTGFNRFLTLPRALAAELGLRYQFRSQVVLANGSEEEFDVCSAIALWDGQPRSIEVFLSDAMILVGMALLDGYDLYVRVAEGGQVVVRESA